MQRLHPLLLCLFATALALLTPVTAQAQARQAPTLDLKFRPPELTVEPICVSRPPDSKTEALWDAWDGGALPDMPVAEIKRDINRLMALDGERWFDQVSRIIDRLEETDPRYRGQNALLARISMYESAGRYDELLRAQLVPQLAAMSDVLSPRAKSVLARLYTDGIGLSRDQQTADVLLMEAGYAGNADALLRLAKRTLNNTAPAGWDVPVDLAVSMGFGALVGELNSSICDRTARIAREYRSGEIVTRDPQLAHDWFRFTADLGDASAAWKVVEYHLEAAEGFQKDNTVLLAYLKQAAEAGLPYAQLELGETYESGALVPQDMEKALGYYEQVAETGDRSGLTRLALFLERHPDVVPDAAQRRRETLDKLIALDDAPGWAFARVAQLLTESDGFWAASADVRKLLEQAAAREDLDGMVRYADLLIADPSGPEDFDTAVNLLARAVSVNGGATPLKKLRAAYTCHAPNAPQTEQATYWAGLEDATATANLDLNAAELIALNTEETPLELAVLQSQALYGRPKALAGWLTLLDYGDFADDEMRAFWDAYSDRFTEVISALAKLDFELARNRSQRNAVFGLLRSEYKRSGADAALTLAKALLDTQNLPRAEDRNAARREGETLLNELARQGIGEAISLLGDLSGSEAGKRAVFVTYRDVIARNGDFAALIYSVPFLEGADQDRALDRAIGVMPCDYLSAMTVAGTMLNEGRTDAAIRWMSIAEELVGRNLWAKTQLAKSMLDVDREETTQTALALLTEAYEGGDRDASRLLFDLRLNGTEQIQDLPAAEAMLTAALDAEDSELLGAYLGRLRRAPQPLRDMLSERIDLTAALQQAAEGGDIYAMRQYGQILRDEAQTPSDLETAIEWIAQAAEGEDTTAMAEYGEALAFGIGTEPDPDAAMLWLQRAAARGSKKAAEITRLVLLSQGTDPTTATP